MQFRRVRGAGRAHIRNNRQFFILNVYEIKRSIGLVLRLSRNGSHFVADE